MKLKYIVPNMAQTFGNLEFAGENDVEQQRVNGRFVPVTRSYNLYSDIQRADDIIVVLPAKAGEKRFKYEQKVKLVNPISDDGKGFSQEELKYATSFFYSSPTNKGNFGIGLSICKILCERLDCILLLKNTADHGACITVQVKNHELF